jgi:predicted ATPase/DNA-binding winged helix-turn-helix (wHTH) protein/tetratricopeptide (TPR) repeat protein
MTRTQVQRDVRLGDRVLRCARGTVCGLDGVDVVLLTPTEVRLLQCLLDHQGQSVSDEQLLEQVWEYSPRSHTRTLSTTVYRLRRKLEPDPTQPKFLRRTLHGYALITDRDVVDPVVADGLREPPTPCFGREAELSALEGLEDRFLSLVGPGGVGKTRMAARLASSLVERLSGGVVVVALAGQEAGAILSTFEVALGTSGGSQDAVGRVLRERGPCLVLVDDCERLVDEVSALVTRLSREAPASRYLFTSRVRLGLPGERLVVVKPLSIDAGVALLADRADRRCPGWSKGNPDAMRSIVTSLDGLPLAIELAASRARVLSAGDLDARLDARFQLLRTGDGDARHQRLSTVLQDSWDLLDSRSQRALCSLAVCGGSFDAGLAEAVLTDEPRAVWAIDVLQDLVDHSLVQSRPETTARFHLLESVRLWCVARWEPGQEAVLMGRLSGYVAARCRDVVEENPFGVAERLGQDRVHIERCAAWPASTVDERGWCAAALCWIARERGGGRLATTLLDEVLTGSPGDALLAHLKFARLRVSRDVTVSAEECRAVLSAVAQSGSERLHLMARAEVLGLEPLLPDLAEARVVTNDARALGDEGVLAHCLRVEATRHMATGAFDLGAARLEEAHPLAMSAGLRLLALMIHSNLALCWAMLGRGEESVQLFESVADRAGQADAPYTQALALFHLGGAHYMLGDLEHARLSALDARRCVLRVDAPLILGQTYLDEGHALEDLGRCEEALVAYALAGQHFANAPEHWGNVIWRVFSGLCHLHLDDLAGAKSVLEGAAESAVPLVVSSVRAVQGLMAALQGDLHRAADLLRPERVSEDGPSQRFWWLVFSLSRVTVLHRLGETSEAASFLETVAGRYGQLHHRLGMDACVLLRARLQGAAAPDSAMESSFSRHPIHILDAPLS